jgi:hypothetical protein
VTLPAKSATWVLGVRRRTRLRSAQRKSRQWSSMKTRADPFYLAITFSRCLG